MSVVSLIGLVVVVVIVALAVAILLDDLRRKLSGLTTWTTWAKRRRWRVALLVSGPVVAAVALWVHLTF